MLLLESYTVVKIKAQTQKSIDILYDINHTIYSSPVTNLEIHTLNSLCMKMSKRKKSHGKITENTLFLITVYRYLYISGAGIIQIQE